MEIKVFADAGSNLYDKVLKNNDSNIKILPMNLYAEDKTYVCYEDNIDVESFSHEFYQKMINGLNVKTSMINQEVFQSKFQEEVDKGNQVICVTISSGISGNFQAAYIVAQSINEKVGREVVHIVDSKTAGFGTGLIALFAEKCTKENISFAELVNKVEEYVYKVRSEFTVDDLKYLYKNGRLSYIVFKIANILNIKVLLNGAKEGKIVVNKKVHGRNLSIKALANQVIEHIVDKDNQTVFISHCDCLEDANRLEEILKENGIANTQVYYYDLITGAHVGPGTLAIFYTGKDRDF